MEKGTHKIPAVTVPSDDCPVAVGRKYDADWSVKVEGETIYPHENEWVKVIPVAAISSFLSIADMMKEADGRTMDPAMMTRLQPAFHQLCDQLARRVIEWNWTDWDGEPMDQPHKRPDVIAQLTEDEVLWLLTAVQGETASTRKKD